MIGKMNLSLTDKDTRNCIFYALASIVIKVFLIMTFYFIFVPSSIFFKLIGRDKLRRKIDKTCKSYWED